MADDGRVRVALDVGAPLPAGRVGVAGADVLGLEALELLLVAKLVGLGIIVSICQSHAWERRLGQLTMVTRLRPDYDEGLKKVRSNF